MVKEEIKAKLIEEIRSDINIDWSVLDELLDMLPIKVLKGALSDTDERSYSCTNCGGGFKHDEMVFDDENDLCKNCAK